MKQSTKEGLLELQKAWCCILLFSIVLLSAARIFWEVYDPPFDLPIIVWAFFQCFVFIIVVFLAFKLAYLHLVVQLGFFVFAVYILIKAKNIPLFLLTIILTVIAVALDISWMQVELVW